MRTTPIAKTKGMKMCKDAGIEFITKTPTPAANWKSRLGGMLLSLVGLAAGTTTAAADPTPSPSLSASLAGNPNPYSMNLGFLGENVYVGGVVSAMGLVQSQATKFPGSFDNPSAFDISNAQVFVQKNSGFFQYYVQAGSYSIPILSVPYMKSTDSMKNSFGVLSQAYVKIQPADNFSIKAGKIMTLFGAEYTFTFQNMNIFRGLLSNQEQFVIRGVQADYTTGPFSFSLALTDGYYSDRWNWITGLASWAIDSENVVSFVGGANMGATGPGAGVATAFAQQNSTMFNLLYTHSAGPWVITPYFQYSKVPTNLAIGIVDEATTTSGAILVSYKFNDNYKLAGRVEYISTTGSVNSPNLLFGQGSKAWSFTVTPTYQYDKYFIRGEFSYVGASDTIPGFALGPNFSATGQSRGVIETGVLF
jgi:Putative beta-barrel porin-2, OmpL-like. bbp2